MECTRITPFLGKNFATAISPWIVTIEAIQPFITDAPLQTQKILPYLQEEKRVNFDIEISFEIELSRIYSLFTFEMNLLNI